MDIEERGFSCHEDLFPRGGRSDHAGLAEESDKTEKDREPEEWNFLDEHFPAE